MNIIGVIPARSQSSRFPGKPLADILGKPMIWWVYNQAIKVKRIDEVYVYDEFKSKDDFDFALPNKTVRTRILEADSNERTWLISGSYDLYTSHVVKEGILAFKYKRYEDGKELDNGGVLIEKVFVPNDEIENIWDNGTFNWKPAISREKLKGSLFHSDMTHLPGLAVCLIGKDQDNF